jgi:hypothetical protein
MFMMVHNVCAGLEPVGEKQLCDAYCVHFGN